MQELKSEQIIVSSKLMQHFRVFSAISPTSQIQAMQDKGGRVQLITLGNDGNLYNLYEDVDSDTGWSLASLNTDKLNFGEVTHFSADIDNNGNSYVDAQFTNTKTDRYRIIDSRWSRGWEKLESFIPRVKDADTVPWTIKLINNQLFFCVEDYQPLISGDVKVSKYDVQSNFEGFLEVFCIDIDGSLYHTRAAPDLTQPKDASGTNTAPGWTRITKLNPEQGSKETKFSQLTIAKDKSGYTQVFVVDVSNKLWSVKQNADTTAWMFEQIELPNYDSQNEGKPSEIKVFMTEITLQDAIGVPMPSSTVAIWSTDETPAVVNGRSITLNSVTPYLCSTNCAGKITLVVEVDSVDAPLYKVSADFMDSEEYITIEPNAYIQDILRNIDADVISNAKNVFSGNKINVVSNNISADTLNAVASGVSQCMSLMGPSGSTESTTIEVPALVNQSKFLARNKKISGLRYVPKGEFNRNIKFSNVEEQHWRFNFDHVNGNHQFEKLSRDKAASLMADRSSSLKSVNLLTEWLDVDWGDVWEDIKSISELVVSTIVDSTTNIVTAIKAQINVIIGDITYLYEAAIDKIEQVFDAVEGIFEAVGVYFEQMFDWLAFLFSWSDILLMQQAVSGIISKVSLPFLTQTFKAGGELNKLITNQIDSFKVMLDSSFSNFFIKSRINGNDSLSGVQATIPQNDINERISGTNLALSSLMDNPGAAKLVNPSSFSEFNSVSLTGSLSDFLTKVGELIPDFINNQAFTNAANYFQAIGDNPDQLLELAFSGILSTIQGMADLSLDLASKVVDKLFECIDLFMSSFSELLNEKIYVPIVSEIYSYITNGQDLTLIGLASFVIAIPSTIIYKLFYNSAPFANATDVDKVIESLNNLFPSKSSLISWPSRSGTTSSAEIPPLVTKILRVVFSGSLLVYGAVEAYLDIWVVDKSGSKPFMEEVEMQVMNLSENTPLISAVSPQQSPSMVISVLAVVLEFAITFASIPKTLVAPSCRDADSAGVLFWILSAFTPICDALLLCVTNTIMRNFGPIGVFIDWLLSFFQLGMQVTLTVMQALEDKVDYWATLMGFVLTLPGVFKLLILEEHTKPILAAIDLSSDFCAAYIELLCDPDVSGATGTR